MTHDEEKEIIKLITKQNQRDNLIRENAAKFAEEFENSSSTINPKMALFDGFKFGAYWADKHPYSDIKRLLHVSQKTTESTKKEFINKACEWLENNINNYIIIDDYLGKVQTKISSSMFDDFKKVMEE